jgi:MYXO-CTERM domain-containing protein
LSFYEKREIMKNFASLASAALVASLAGAASANIVITEAYSNGNGNAANTYQADWFELTNTGTSAVNISGWLVDDASNGTPVAQRLALRNITTINPGESVIFIETNAAGSTDATVIANFRNAWFGTNPAAWLQIGTYGGSGIGLGTGGDSVNIFESAAGPRVTGIAFGTATLGVTFDNAAGLGSTTLPLPSVSTLSSVGVNGARTSLLGNEVGSPGVIPTPGAVALLGLAGLAASRRRR